MLNPTLVYKRYNSDGYQGEINVVNDIAIPKEINSAGSEIVLKVPVEFLDTASDLEIDSLATENNDDIVDEQLDEIVVDERVVVVGIPNVGDEIQVYLYDTYNPNGVLVYNGQVIKWTANGSVTDVYVRSYGFQTNNYLIQILPSDVQISQSNTNDELRLIFSVVAGPTDFYACYQTFTPNSDITADSIDLYGYISPGSGFGLLQMNLREGTPSSPGLLLSTSFYTILSEVTGTLRFALNTSTNLQNGSNYYIEILKLFGTSKDEVYLEYDTNDSYADGSLFTNDLTNGIVDTGGDLRFNINTNDTAGIGSAFYSQDPSDIFRDLLDNFASLGGRVSYTEDTVDNTNTVTTYIFKTNTYLDGLKKCVELAPSNWYFYIDPGSNLAYFKTTPDTHSHVFEIGENVENVEVSYTIENLVNNSYVAGAESEGERLLENYRDTESISQYGTWTTVDTDGRITVPATAQLLARNKVLSRKEPEFQIKVDIVNYDISSIQVGELIKFRNSNNLMNSLELMVVGVLLTASKATVFLGALPPTVNKRIEDIKRNLRLSQTENNPNE